MMKTLRLLVVVGAMASVAAWGGVARAQNRRGSSTGPTTAKGYNDPSQAWHVQDIKPADNMYPVVPHPQQDKAARDKLAELEKRTGRKPNVLVFLMDDVGWMDPGFNGGGVAVGNDTPTMDRLANEGLILTSAYSAPSCTPTRASIHTGQNPLHHGLLRPPMYGEPGGLEGVVTLPAILQKLGYVTQGIGKWHMGENQSSLPQNVGYDDYRGFLGVSDMYTEWRDVDFNPEIALNPERFAMIERQPFSKSDVHCTPKNATKCEEVGVIDLDSIKNLDQEWMKYSLDFIKRMAISQQPFFLYHATRGCHFDNYPNDQWAGRSVAHTTYADCMVEMDYILGQLVKALQDAGQLENTLILMTSDNGPECEVPPHGHTPFRGCKGSSWEGGVRVPTFVSWKGMIKPRKSDGLFDVADLLPTIVSLAGHPGAELAPFFAKDTYIDGVDQASFLVADGGQSSRRSRPYTLNQYFSAMRVDEFKYIFTAELENGFFDKGHTGGFSGPIITETGGAVLVNLYTDPQEDVSVGIRHIPSGGAAMLAAGIYMKELLRYPPQYKIGFLSNNPPYYNFGPTLKQAVKQWWQGAPEPAH